MPNITDSTDPLVTIGYGGQGIVYAYGYMGGSTIKRRSIELIKQADVSPTSFIPSAAVTSKSGSGYLKATLDGDFPKYFEQSDQG